MVLLAILMIPLFGFLALSVDFDSSMVAKSQQEAALDYVALGALEEFVALGATTPIEDRYTAAIQRAEEIGNLNLSFEGEVPQIAIGGLSSGSQGLVEFGKWDLWHRWWYSVGELTNPGKEVNAVRVSMVGREENAVKMIFGRIFGVNSMRLRSSSLAIYDSYMSFKGRTAFRVVRADFPVLYVKP